MAQNLRVFVMHYVAGWKIRNMFEAVALNRWEEEAIQKQATTIFEYKIDFFTYY